MLKENIDKYIKHQAFKYTYFHIILLSFMLYQYDIIPQFLPFMFFIIFKICEWIKFDTIQLLSAIEYSLNILAAIFLISIYYLNLNYYVFVNVFLLLIFFVNYKQQNEEDQQIKEYIEPIKYLKILSNCFLLVASSCLTIKLNNFTNWSWPQTFWWYWMYLSTLIGSAFAIILVLLTKIMNQYYFKKIIIQRYEYITFIFALYFFLITSLIALLWIINTFTILNIQEDIYQGKISFFVLISINIILFPIIITFSQFSLSKFIVSFLISQNEQQELPLPSSPRVENKQKQIIIGNNILMKKISSSFFRIITKEEQIIFNNKLQKQKQNNNNQSILNKIFKKNRISKIPQNSNNTHDTMLQTEQECQKCIICCEKLPNCVLLPCYHGGICYDCAIENTHKNKECFLCRQQINEIDEIKYIGDDYIQVISKTII